MSYRIHLGETCRACGFVPVDLCQLDVDHIDGDHANDAPENLQTLCSNCHRLKTKRQRQGWQATRSTEPLRFRRHRVGLAQERLAHLAGVTRQTIANLEAGAVPSYPTAVRVARALGTKPALLWPRP